MKKNLKHSIVFILIVLTLLLVVIMSLAASKPTRINTIAVSISKYGMQSGLGMGLFSTSNTSLFDGYVDELVANGFTQLRVDIPTYTDATWVAKSKAAVIRAITNHPGIKIIWGVSSNGTTITSANWQAFRTAIKDAALWAQDNGVYEFQLGNEEEYHNDNTTFTDAQLITNLKSVATEVKAIFTRGNVSYTCWQANAVISAWITAGKGDLDILASNVYKGGSKDAYDTSYQTRIQNLVNAFGVSGTYLTEFGPSYTSLAHYSTDEAVQAAAMSEMISYIKTLGMTRAIFFDYADDDFGARYGNSGPYRLLWNVLIS